MQQLRALVRVILCSTPFGITEYIGGGDARGVRDAAMCSTPFGITEYIGGGQGGGAAVHVVLNAFRHHGVYRSA